MGQYYIAVNLSKGVYLDFVGCSKLWEIAMNVHHADRPAMLMHLLATEWAGDRVVVAGDYDDEGLFTEEFAAAAEAAGIPRKMSEDSKADISTMNLYHLVEDYATGCKGRTQQWYHDVLRRYGIGIKQSIMDVMTPGEGGAMHFSMADLNITQATRDAIAALPKQPWWFLNHDAKEIVALGEDSMPVAMNKRICFAVVGLLASGNGRGGGDLPTDWPWVGRWAGQRVELTADRQRAERAGYEDITQEVWEVFTDPEDNY